MEVDDPGVAEAIVTHAEDICEDEDHLWDVLDRLSIPVDLLTDRRTQSRVAYETKEMVKAHLYMQIRGFSQNELADRLRTRTTLLKSFGFDVKHPEDAPSQQDLSYAKQNFSDETQLIIEAAAKGIGQAAVKHDVISEGLVPVLPDDEDDEDEEDGVSEEYKKQKASKTIRLARRHVLPEFDTGRAAHREYSDEAIWDMFARICERRGSAHSEGEYGWLTDDSLTCHGSTFLRAIKKAATPDDAQAQTTLDEVVGEDTMPYIDQVRDTVMESFDAATDNILSSIRGEDPFDDRRTVAAIDVTYEQFHVYPWEDKDAGEAKPDYPPMVSGHKKDNEVNYYYKFATITLVGENAPIILGVEPVKENSGWEPDGAPSYSKATTVERLIEKAQRFVDLDEVLLDREFYSTPVYAAIEEHDLLYTTPVPKYEDDLGAIKKIEEHPTTDAAVKHDVPFGIDGEVHHRAEFLYVPTKSDDADGSYAVFVTNRDYVDPSDIDKVCGQYQRRWDIEIQYQSIKKFLPKTSSKDYRVRLCKFVVTALIYNLWRLTDYLIKAALGRAVRSKPVVTATTFVRALGDFLRKNG